jgi:hypothetical protein
MYCAWMILKCKPDIYSRPRKLEEVYEVIIGIQKFIKSVTGYKGKSLINSLETIDFSNLLLIDLQRWLDKLTEKYPIDGYKLYTIAPKLLFFCKFDDARPGRGITPRTSQKEVMKYIQDNPNGHLIIYKAMVNSGKTTFAGSALPSYVKKYRLAHNNSKLQALFCCCVENVCFDVASVAYANNIKFGFANIENNSVKIINSYLCSKDDDRILIIAGLDASLKLLMDDKKRMDDERQKYPDKVPTSNYILFHDEVTADSDYLESDVLLKNMQVLRYCPDKTILSSATLPDVEQLTEFTQNYINRFPQFKDNIHTVVSNEIHSACDMYSYEGTNIIPHFGCKTIDELKKAYYVINKIPFLGRLYTPLVVKKMWDEMQGINNLPDIKVVFSDTNNMKPDSVRKVAMQMLECLINTNSDELVNKLCHISFDLPKNTKEKKQKEADEDDITWINDDEEVEEEEYNPTKIRLDKLADKDAHKIAGGITLITSSNPLEFALNTFGPYLEMLEKQGYDSVKKILQSYEKELDAYNEQIKRLEERVKSEDVRSQKIQQLQQSHPQINFPSVYQINTRRHLIKYASKHKEYINKYSVRSEFPPEKHPNNFSVDEKLKLLLWCGIAVYNPNIENSQIDRFYTNYVHQMMSTNQLAIVVSNKKIIYGSNYPIRTVITDDEFSEKHSMNSLFQLFGRAGRVGLAYRATVYISNTLSKKLYNFIHIDSGINLIEVNNMNEIMYRLNKEEQNLIIAKQEKEKLDILNKQKRELEKEREEKFNEYLKEQERLEKEKLEEEMKKHQPVPKIYGQYSYASVSKDDNNGWKSVNRSPYNRTSEQYGKADSSTNWRRESGDVYRPPSLRNEKQNN